MAEPTDEPGQEPNEPDQTDDVESASGEVSVSDETKRLRAEAKSRRLENRELAAKLKEYENRDKTEQQRLDEERAAAMRERDDAVSRLMRFEVAAEVGLPSKWASRLQGSDRDELKADAEELLRDWGGEEPAATRFNGGVRRPVPSKPKDMNEFLREVAKNR